MKAHDWPFAAALSMVLMAMTGVFIYLCHRISRALGGSGDLEGLV
jgi:spermidine/putrescine transport system permease protein